MFGSYCFQANKLKGTSTKHQLTSSRIEQLYETNKQIIYNRY